MTKETLQHFVVTRTVTTRFRASSIKSAKRAVANMDLNTSDEYEDILVCVETGEEFFL